MKNNSGTIERFISHQSSRFANFRTSASEISCCRQPPSRRLVPSREFSSEHVPYHHGEFALLPHLLNMNRPELTVNCVHQTKWPTCSGSVLAQTSTCDFPEIDSHTRWTAAHSVCTTCNFDQALPRERNALSFPENLRPYAAPPHNHR